MLQALVAAGEAVGAGFTLAGGFPYDRLGVFRKRFEEALEGFQALERSESRIPGLAASFSGDDGYV